ncbi:DUF4955 domain-containing protein, partial [Belliella pelovolcani]|uniref:DUF4955 domain-containing protein n=1 Tax=Belliella pelovolcani TaxID=529505 RepID=UPI00391B4377
IIIHLMMLHKNSAMLFSILFSVLVSFKCNSQVPEGGIFEELNLIDFSYAGYDFGESELPVTYDLPVFKVEDFGAKANDNISDQEAIQRAIDQAQQANGGVILFEAGEYIINNTKGSNKSGIVITSSNIILKGAGSGKDGTILHMKNPLEPLFPNKLWSTPPMISFQGKGDQSINVSLAESVKLGDRTIIFKGSHGLNKNDKVVIRAEGDFLNDRLLEGKETREIWSSINERGGSVYEIHEVADVFDNKVTFRAPILIDMDKNEPWEFEKISLIQNCGFENIRFQGNFDEPFVHHKNAYHDGGYTALRMDRTYNSWVRDCVFVDVNVAATFNGSLTGTILNCEMQGIGGHSSFGSIGSTRVLIADCSDQANQWHGPNTSSNAVATVILRFTGINRGIDAHGSNPRHTLWDDCEMAGFDGDDVGRASHGASFTNLPNHSVGLVFWNFKQTDRARPDFDFWDLMEDNPNEKYGPLTAVNPIIVGFQGEGTSFINAGIIKSFGEEVNPTSLYMYQLNKRTTKIPKYLTYSQRQAIINEMPS